MEHIREELCYCSNVTDEDDIEPRCFSTKRDVVEGPSTKYNRNSSQNLSSFPTRIFWSSLSSELFFKLEILFNF